MPIESPYIFISYKTEERDVAQRVRQALSTGTDARIWWDQDLQAGGQWSEDLDAAVREAACIVVLWSELSVESDWVQQEAAIGKASDKLVPARLDNCDIPRPYQQIQTADLTKWDESEQHPEFRKLSNAALKLVNQQLQDKADAEPSPVFEVAPKKRWWLSLLLPAFLTLAALALVYLQFATNSQVKELECLTTALREISASQVKRDILLIQQKALLEEQTVFLEEAEGSVNQPRKELMQRQLKNIDEELGQQRDELDRKTDELSQENYCEKG